MYADDVVFYSKHINCKTTEKLLQEDATRVYNRFCKSGLCINTEKTKIVMFDWCKTHTETIITMGGHTLNQRNEYEYHGVTIDSNPNFEWSINKTISTVSHRLYLLCKARKMMSKPTACLIYKQTILSVIEYCGFICNGLTDAICARIQRVQNKCQESAYVPR